MVNVTRYGNLGVFVGCLITLSGSMSSGRLHAQESAPRPAIPSPPALAPEDRPLAITLPAALQLANVRAVDVNVAAERIRVAEAALEQANVLWLPTVTLGGDYYRHDGRNQ